MPQVARPDRMYRIGEAAQALKLKTCVLRFWESEFPQLSPVRTPKGQRLYTEEHMALLRRIQSLLHEQGMTIEGARRVLSGQLAAPAAGAGHTAHSRKTAWLPPAAAYPDLFSAMASPSPVSPPSSAAPSACSEPSAVSPADDVLRAAVAELESLRGFLLTTPSPLSAVPSPGSGSAARPQEPEGACS